jgi:hypothetical protein
VADELVITPLESELATHAALGRALAGERAAPARELVPLR